MRVTFGSDIGNPAGVILNGNRRSQARGAVRKTAMARREGAHLRLSRRAKPRSSGPPLGRWVPPLDASDMDTHAPRGHLIMAYVIKYLKHDDSLSRESCSSKTDQRCDSCHAWLPAWFQASFSLDAHASSAVGEGIAGHHHLVMVPVRACGPIIISCSVCIIMHKVSTFATMTYQC